MNLITLIVLISAYAVLTYFQNQKVKRKVVKIIAGELEDRQLSNLINRAKISSKKKFAAYLCFFQGLILSIVFIIVVFTVNTLFYNNELDIAKHMFVLLFVIVTFSVTAIIKANTIWRLVNN